MPRSRLLERVALVVVSAALAFAVIDVILRARDAADANVVRESESTPGYYVPEDVLGDGPQPGARSNVVEAHGTETIDAATYTIGADGLRISPAAHSTEPRDCALFFGDSFTYRAGLNIADFIAARLLRR